MSEISERLMIYHYDYLLFSLIEIKSDWGYRPEGDMRKNENIFLYFQYLYKAIETESTEGSEVKERIALYIVWLIV